MDVQQSKRIYRMGIYPRGLARGSRPQHAGNQKSKAEDSLAHKFPAQEVEELKSTQFFARNSFACASSARTVSEFFDNVTTLAK